MTRTVVMMTLACMVGVVGWPRVERAVSAAESDGVTDRGERVTEDVCCTAPARSLPDTEDVTQIRESASEQPLVPIVCTLTDSESRERRDKLRDLLTKAATNVARDSNSVTVVFADGHSAEVLNFVELERACCPFFTFTLRFPSGKPMELTVSAPEGGAMMLDGLFPEKG